MSNALQLTDNWQKVAIKGRKNTFSVKLHSLPEYSKIVLIREHVSDNLQHSSTTKRTTFDKNLAAGKIQPL